MSFLKNILGNFVEFKEDKATPSHKKTDDREISKSSKAAADDGGLTPSAVAAATTQARQLSGKASSAVEYKEHFEELIEEANKTNPFFQGTDFKEFIDSKGDVEGIADEATRYRTAFNVLKRTGLSKEKLVSTGQAYLDVVDRDIKAFEDVYMDQYKTQVERKEQLLQQKAQELQTLTEKMEALNKDIKQMSQEILQSKDKLNANRNSFILAGENMKKEIQTELKKVDEYFS